MNRKKFIGALGAGALGVGAIKSIAQTPPATAMPVTEATLGNLLCLDDVEAAARSQMSESVYNFVAGGAADELTIGWSREKYRDMRLQERVLNDVSNLDCSTTILGQR